MNTDQRDQPGAISAPLTEKEAGNAIYDLGKGFERLLGNLVWEVAKYSNDLNGGPALTEAEEKNLEANLYQLLTEDTLGRRFKTVLNNLTNAGYEATMYVPEIVRGL